VVDGELLNKIYFELKRQKLTIATAESCTGGLIGHTFTNVSGSSENFERGIIAYSNKAKIELLGVSKSILEEHGAVSKEVAEAMAEGVRKRSKVNIGISTTGIAGPLGGTEEKPVGLVYIAISTEKNIIVKKFIFTGTRIQNKESTCNVALNVLLEILTS
jgi:nicotinamide-nucleotide amidase